MPSYVRGAALAHFAAVADRIGLDAGVFLRRHGIDLRTLHEPDQSLRADGLAELLEESARASGCQTIGLQMAEMRTLADLGPLALLIEHRTSLRAVLGTMIQHRRLMNPALVLSLEERPPIALVQEELLVDDGGPVRQAHELIVATIFQLFRTARGSGWRPLSVNFMHAAPGDLAVHMRIFGPCCEFDSDFNGLTLAAGDLDVPLRMGDPGLAPYAEQYLAMLPSVGAVSVTDDVRKALHLLLPEGVASVAGVAARLGVPERTLQRRLAGEGAEFSALLSDVRRQLVTRHLGNPNLPLSRVAALVGYERQSSFNRWFRGEFGLSPNAWRGEHP